MNENQITTTHIVENLISEITCLRQELKDTLEQWYLYNNEIKPRLLALYDSFFREFEIEIQNQSLQLSDIQRRVELLTIKAKRGEKLTPEIISAVNILVDKEFERFYVRMNEFVDRNTSGNTQKSNAEFRDSEIPKIYRFLVKKLHPDYNDITDFTQKMWQRTQEAYTNKDSRTLHSLYEMLVGSEQHYKENIVHCDDVEQLLRVKKDLTKKVEYEKKKVEKLFQQEPFTLEKVLKDEIWINSHRLDLKKTIEKSKNEFNQAQLRYKELTGQNHSATDNKPKDNHFDDSFSENTYFGQR